jgi:hypothetical protein
VQGESGNVAVCGDGGFERSAQTRGSHGFGDLGFIVFRALLGVRMCVICALHAQRQAASSSFEHG